MTAAFSARSGPRGNSRGDIAIIGMACMFPGAPDLGTYWRNILSKLDAVTDPPASAWDPAVFYDPHSSGNDRVYCKRGGYLTDVARFNPLQYGVMPVTVEGGEPDQWLALDVAHAALADAGYLDRATDRGRAEVILGKGTYINRGNLTVGYHSVIVEQVVEIIRTLHPDYPETGLLAIKQQLKASLPPFGPDTAPGLVPNIIAGRIANRLDFTGPSYTVDGACASALIATEIAVGDLLNHQCDLALVGGVHVSTPVPMFMLFCQLGALSRHEQIRPFDKDADGTILGEGLGMVVLKRLEDARRDGDRIYAVIKGVGTSSDGRAVHVMAPRVEGEELALRLAYDNAGVAPRSVGLIEAHGTATPIGDAVEIQALRRVFGERDGGLPTCALGSVKSMIGHTMPAAGMAGLIKAALALYHKVLPPTLHCEVPSPKLELDRTPFYVNTDIRPWIHGSAATRRRAGVNAFGFGGINAHAVLEEGPDDDTGLRKPLLHWDTEVCILGASSRDELVEKAHHLHRYLAAAPTVRLEDVAFSLNTSLGAATRRLAIVASSTEDLKKKLTHAARRLADPRCERIKDVTGIYFFEEPQSGKLAFLFPGEGAQYANMLADLCLHFPEVRARFDLADRAYIGHPRRYVPSDFIFPRRQFSPEEPNAVAERLWQIDGAVEAVLIANWAMLTLLTGLQIRPDVIVGHSTGDYSAMLASGIIKIPDDATYIDTILTWHNAHARLASEVQIPAAALVAVAADVGTVTAIIEEAGDELYVAMDNCAHQTVIVGSKASAQRVVELLRRRGVIYESLPFDRPYHTPMFRAYADAWCRAFFAQQLTLSTPDIPVYSCTTTAPYPSDVPGIRDLFVEHWARPVRFRETVEALYADGVRLFVEVGPRGNLTSFVGDILRGLPHLAVASNVAHRPGVTQLNHLVGLLGAHHVSMCPDYLYARRAPQRLLFDEAGAAGPDERERGPIRLSLGIPTLRAAPPPPTAVDGTGDGRGSTAPGLDGPEATRPVGSRPHVPAPGTPPALRHLSSPLVQDYLATMDHFLDVQRDVMKQFLTSAGRGRRPPAALTEVHQPSTSSAVSGGPETAFQNPPPLPLLGTVTSCVPGQELVAIRRLDADDDLFLRQHTLGGRISADETRRPLAVVPLTVSMEMMAEAACTLIPGRCLVGMRDVRANRWIRVEDAPVTLEIAAVRASSALDEVEVRIHVAGELGEARDTTPAVQGVVVLGPRYPERPAPAPFALASERTSALAATNLYDSGLMFHGPCFQGVVSVDRSGQDGIVGQLRVLPRSGLFRSIPAPQFVTDPVVLDAAGQLLGFWAAEYLERGFVVFPYRLDALEIYGPNRSPGERLTGQLKLHRLGSKQIGVDLDVLTADGTLWMRLVGWEDMRFDLPAQFHRFWVAPRDTPLSVRWPAPIAAFPQPEAFECRRLEPLLEASASIWKDLWASLMLTPRESEAYRRLKGPENRRSEWLAGRAAAKDAVRMLLRTHDGMSLFPADVEIGQDDGRPFVGGEWTGVTVPPALSVAHSRGTAVALAGRVRDGQRLGIDIERVRPMTPGFEAVACGGNAGQLLASLPAALREEWVLRVWCAKEAVGKALGRGLIEGPNSVGVLAVEPPTGLVTVALRGKLLDAFPEFAGRRIVVYTARDGAHVVATTLCEVSA